MTVNKLLGGRGVAGRVRWFDEPRAAARGRACNRIVWAL
jgi:hypothetical protein